MRLQKNSGHLLGIEANCEGVGAENLSGAAKESQDMSFVVEYARSKDFHGIETRWFFPTSQFNFRNFQLLLGCYLNIVTATLLTVYIGTWLEVNMHFWPSKDSSLRDNMIVFVRYITSPILFKFLLFHIAYSVFEVRKLGMLLLDICISVPLLQELTGIVMSNMPLLANSCFELRHRLSERRWIQSLEKNPKKGKKPQESGKTTNEGAKSDPPPLEPKPEEPKPEPPPAPKKDPRIVHEPVKPYHGLALGSRVEQFLLHPGDIMITHWSRPPYDPPVADPLANPGGHCTLFVDHGYFERREKHLQEIERMRDKCFDDGDMILRFGSFDVYWTWSPQNPIECFEFQYHTPPASWFLFSRVQAKPLPSPPMSWNRRWMVLNRQQPDPPDTQAIRPRLGDLIIRRAEAVVWWRHHFKVQPRDLLIRAGYKRVAASGRTLAAVEMYECSISSSEEFTGRSYVTRYHTHWTFRGRDTKLYGEGMIGQGGDSIDYNGPLRHPMSNRSDFRPHELM